MISKENKERIITWILRALIITLIIVELGSNRDIILLLYILVFLFTFIPSIVERVLKFKFPFGFEFLYDLFLLSAALFEKLLSGIFVSIVHGLFFGFIGFLIMYILYYNSSLKSTHYLFAFISFSISVSLGVIWQILIFPFLHAVETRVSIIDIGYGFEGSLIITICAAIVSIIGFFYMKYGEGKIENRLLSLFRHRNPELFTDDAEPKQVLNMIKTGENEKLEFKSTLRINLHTKKPDKKIEDSFLKTINAFLNTDGGTLLIGVSDNGTIIGIEKDGFPNNDKLYRHYSNLIKYHIGNEYLPFIKSSIIEIDDKHILKIKCYRSNKETFLKTDDNEDFYVRSGSASVKLVGTKLIDYVNSRFKN